MIIGTVAMTSILVGGLWLADALFGFRFDQTDTFYPFHPAARQTAAFLLLGTGIVLAWIESKLHAHRLHH